MRIYEIIKKKRDREDLTEEEIKYFVESLDTGEIEDYQTTALLMAIYLNGMNSLETSYLTKAMIESGDVVDLSDLPGIKVDKHSTGGVGDTTTLVLAPLVSACGVTVAKMSGRGLGHTGGTLDKLESIPNFRIDLTAEEFKNNVKKIGLAVVGQTKNICPADKKLYALRDVTATVEQNALIASSIMSKKLASGADAIVLDVKTGSGAFMKDLDSSRDLAKEMLSIAEHMGKKVTTVLTDMSQPLGFAIGNTIEVVEAIETLKNKGPKDLTDLCVELASEMVYYGLGGEVKNREEAKSMVIDALESGAALEKFRDMVSAQGGDASVIDDYSILKQPLYTKSVLSEKSGYVGSFMSEEIGLLSVKLGAGREKKGDPVDYSAGILIRHKIGDSVEEGDELAVLYSDKKVAIEEAEKELLGMIEIDKDKPEVKDIVLEVISGSL